MALKLRDVDKMLANDDRLRILLYGANRSGKTYFASTFPRPLFVVSKIGKHELKTVEGLGIRSAVIDGMKDGVEQIRELADLIMTHPEKLPYIPLTVVIDNMTSISTVWESELANDEGKVGRSDWGMMKAVWLDIMIRLHRLPCHIIWVCHPKITYIEEKDAQGKTIRRAVGELSINGAAKDVIPGNCSHMLYTEQIDRGAKGPGYYVWGRKRENWNAGVRLSRVQKQSPFTKIGPEPSPSYDELAKVLGLPSKKEAEEAEE